MRKLANAQTTKQRSTEEIFMSMMDNISNLINVVDKTVEESKYQYENDETVYNYVMKNENGLVKIGISKDIDVRQKTLEYASGYEIVDIFYTKPLRKANIVESELHKYFNKSRKLGEWFYVDYDKAVEKTKEFAQIESTLVEEKNYNKEERILKSLSLLASLGRCDEDILDYYVISNVIKTKKIENIKELLHIYIERYITTGEEAYNLFCLYLLLHLEKEYSLNTVEFENGNKSYRAGHTVYFYEKISDIYDCLDFHNSMYSFLRK